MAMTASEVDLHVGQRMRQRREFLGVSQGRLGRHLGLTFSQVQKYEKGTNRIGAGRLYLLADFFGVPVQYFFEGLSESTATIHESPATMRESPAAIRGNGSSRMKDAELVALDDAFLAITDRETRETLLALICSIADTADPAETPRQSAG